MLTQTDLQAITKIVKTEVKAATGDLEKKFNKKFKQIETNLKKMDHKLDYAIDFLDEDYLKLKKRVERIETHLNLSPISSF